MGLSIEEALAIVVIFETIGFVYIAPWRVRSRIRYDLEHGSWDKPMGDMFSRIVDRKIGETIRNLFNKEEEKL